MATTVQVKTSPVTRLAGAAVAIGATLIYYNRKNIKPDVKVVAIAGIIGAVIPKTVIIGGVIAVVGVVAFKAGENKAELQNSKWI